MVRHLIGSRIFRLNSPAYLFVFEAERNRCFLRLHRACVKGVARRVKRLDCCQIRFLLEFSSDHSNRLRTVHEASFGHLLQDSQGLKQLLRFENRSGEDRRRLAEWFKKISKKFILKFRAIRNVFAHRIRLEQLSPVECGQLPLISE